MKPQIDNRKVKITVGFYRHPSNTKVFIVSVGAFDVISDGDNFRIQDYVKGGVIFNGSYRECYIEYSGFYVEEPRINKND